MTAVDAPMDLTQAVEANGQLITQAEFFSRLGTDGPNGHDAGPEPTIKGAQNKVFMHAKTGHLYMVQGFGWDSGRDRWLIRYVRFILGEKKVGMVRDQSVPDYYHLPEDFYHPGRFLEVK